MLELNIVSELKKLRRLDLSGNSLLISKGSINSTFSKLNDLSLSSCNLHEFPDFLKDQNELALPSRYFKTWTGMVIVPDKDKLQPKYMGDDFYYKD
ncbi:hypothetical protein CFP56_025108 [Quercus suber]|uniref:Uncharacterized protein n=1 Tax=Quercus suber TaxID=58331 RepID=A0AAW0K4E7_QUESU